jgi:hypothetical protein
LRKRNKSPLLRWLLLGNDISIGWDAGVNYSVRGHGFCIYDRCRTSYGRRTVPARTVYRRRQIERPYFSDNLRAAQLAIEYTYRIGEAYGVNYTEVKHQDLFERIFAALEALLDPNVLLWVAATTGGMCWASAALPAGPRLSTPTGRYVEKFHRISSWAAR